MSTFREAACPCCTRSTWRWETGEAVCLLGRNGMGKTTLLRTVMGLTPASGGRVVFRGQEIQRRPTHVIATAGIGYVPQGRGIFSNLSVEENLLIGRRSEVSEVLDDIYGLFPILADRRGQAGGTLSGGEQQMLAIARCLVMEPKLFLLDEPTEGLQPSIVQRLEEVLPAIRERFGLAFLLVEQNLDFAFAVTNRGYVLERVGESDMELSRSTGSWSLNRGEMLSGKWRLDVGTDLPGLAIQS